MTLSLSSYKVHRLVEYLKSVGFAFEADEILEMGVLYILRAYYDIEENLTWDEIGLLRKELLLLAEANELREARVKDAEARPVDSGKIHFHGEPKPAGERVTAYTLPFSYPADEVMRQIRPKKRTGAPGAFFFVPAKKARGGNGRTEVRA